VVLLLSQGATAGTAVGRLTTLKTVATGGHRVSTQVHMHCIDNLNTTTTWCLGVPITRHLGTQSVVSRTQSSANLKRRHAGRDLC